MHSQEEIVNKAKKSIGFLDVSVLAEKNEIKVYVTLPFKEDGVLYGYDVAFEKTINEAHGIVWEYVSYIRTL